MVRSSMQIGRNVHTRPSQQQKYLKIHGSADNGGNLSGTRSFSKFLFIFENYSACGKLHREHFQSFLPINRFGVKVDRTYQEDDEYGDIYKAV